MFKPNRPESMPQPCIQRAPDSWCLRPTKMGLPTQQPNAIDLWRQDLRDVAPDHPDRHCGISDFCALAHDSCAALLPTLSRPHAVAIHFAHGGQLATEPETAGVRPCWASQKKSHREVACEGSPWGNVVGTLRRSNLRLTRSKFVSFDAVTAAR